MLSTFIPAARAAEFDARAFLQSPQAGYGDGVHSLGFKPAPPGDYRSAGASRSMSLGLTLSSSVDLSAQLPPVGNQGSQGSCVAWATSYYYKTWSEKREHTGWNLTNTQYQFSPSFVYNQINGGADNGSTFPDAFDVLQNKGDIDLAGMPYSAGNCTTQPTAAQLEAAKPYRIQGGWNYLWMKGGLGAFASPNDVSNAKSWLNDGKMLVMGIPIYYDFPNFGGNPVKQYYDFNGTAGFAGGHGVAIVGYDDNINPSGSDTDHRGGFKMVNSWGAGWNGGGYVYLSYDFVKRYVWEAWTMSDLTTADSPIITTLSAGSGSVGDSIDINGNNFGTRRRASAVTFNGTAATQVTFTNAKVTATVPTGATSGSVVVYDWEGTASNAVSFTVGSAAKPAAGSISVNSGVPGSQVTITGSGFRASRGSSSVAFGTSSLSSIDYVSWSNGKIVVKVPGGANGKPLITVSTAGGRSNGVSFRVVPRISTLSPTSGPAGSEVTINGAGFGRWSNYTRVYFGTRMATTYTLWSSNRVRIRVPSGVRGSVPVTLRTAGGTSAAKTFVVR